MSKHVVTTREKKLWDRYHKENKPESVRNELVMFYDDYIKWVCAKLYRTNYGEKAGVWEDDFYQIGVMESLSLIESYDTHKAEFITHLAFMLPKRLCDYIRHNSYIKRHNMKRFLKRMDIEDEMKNDDSEENLQEYMQLDDKQFSRFLSGSKLPQVQRLFWGVETEYQNDYLMLLHEIVSDTKSPDPYDVCMRKDFQEHILRKVPLEYRMAVKLYFFTDLTMNEIGQSMGYSESRISQKIKLALQILPSEISRQFIESQ